jgi:GNAT superfamily N-acetyltransferase
MHTIRKIQASDMSAAHELIRELAVYERAEHELINTPENMLHDWSNGLFNALVLCVDDRLIGLALYYYRYSTWKGKCLYLEDFVLQENKRRLGYGQMMWDALVTLAKEEQCKKLCWQVLDWNQPAIEFYQRQNAHLDGEWVNGSVDLI